MSATVRRFTFALQFALALVFCCAPSFLAAQESVAETVPHLTPFSGTVVDSDGHPRSGITGITFALYKEQTGGVPLWLETQNVAADNDGHYTASLGATKAEGLPVELFTSGEARWLGVQPDGQAEQPRVLLLSVPYALKAADAETVGGLPPSAFVLANGAPGSGAAKSDGVPGSTVTPRNSSVTGKGVLDFVPMWDSASDIVDSLIFQKSSEIGINTTAPAATLDVNGKSDVRDTLTLFPKGTDPTLAINGTAFKVDQTGKVTFASGQTFPGTGAGTITGVTTAAGSGLSGGGTKGTLALGLTKTCTAKQTLQWSGSAWACSSSGTGTITGVTTASGSGLTGGGTRGTLKLGLLTSCSSGQTLAWNGSAWACTTVSGGGSGTVTSVALTAPTADFTVSGSPVTSNGTLGLNWNIAPNTASVPNSIVKRNGSGGFSAGNIVSTDLDSAGTLEVAGTSYLRGGVSVGSANAPQATLNVNVNGTATSDTLLVGNNTTRGAQLRDTGSVIDFESIGVGMCVNCATGQPTYFGNAVGIGTSGPQALLNLNLGGAANSDTLLLGNNSNKGIQMRDNGTGVDLESIGVPLNINFVTQQPTYINPNGGAVFVDTTTSEAGPQVPAALNVGAIVYQTTGSPLYYSAAFSNDVDVYGNFFAAGTKNFRIDHPLDPANKYLLHAAIESSEVLNQYSGNVVLDDKGEGRVEFPDWFAAINVDFRYQLTAIGAPGPNLYIAEEITDKSFTIAGGKAGMKVSWQVTARRNDAYMKAHPYVVEQEKPERERGYYTDPSLYGAPKEQGIWGAHQATAKKP
jgi:hypothetical protein